MAIDKALPLLFLMLKSGRSSAATPKKPDVFVFPSPAPVESVPTFVAPASVAPSGSPATVQPAPSGAGIRYIGVPVGTRPAGNWKPYSPMRPEVVTTARNVLASKARSLIGPDPARPGRRVFYQAEYVPGTPKRKVTAWMQA